MTVRRRLAVGVLIVAVLLIAGRAVTGVYVDYRWYDALDAGDVWRDQITNGLLLRGASAAVATLFVFANLYAVRHSVVSLVLPRRLANLEIGEEVPGRHLVLAAVVLSALCGAALALPQEAWTAYVLARDGLPFGEGDPYFQHDLGFFVYWLPFERTLYLWAVVAAAVVVTVVVSLYALTPSLRLARGKLYVSTYVRRHLTVLGGVLLLLLAWSFRLDLYQVLSSGSGDGGAFTFVDHRVAIPGDLVLAVVTLGAALVVVWSGWTGQIRLAFFAVTAVLGLSLLVKQLAPALARRLADESDPGARERPYTATRALYARRAYGVDQVVADTSTAYSSVAELARGVAVWDAPAILRTLERSRPGRVYAAGVGWLANDGGVTAMVAERPAAAVADNPVHWNVVRVLATDADEQGDVLRVGDGEPLAGPAVIHDTTAPPITLANPDGRIAGTELRGRLSRLAHAWALQEARLLWGDLPGPRPVLVVRRGVRDRVRALVPFFAQGTLVAPLVVADSLYWAVDLYSSSRYYPLSDPTTLAGEELTYLRHAAVALVDAATGRVKLVADTALDPVAATWRRRFPGLFTDWSLVREDLRGQVQPATDGLAAQAVAFARHANDGRAPAVRRLPPHYGADTALAGSRPVFALDRPRSIAAAVPVLDEADHVAGILVAIGGPRSRTRWYPARGAGLRWGAVLAQLRPADGRPRRDMALARGPVRTVPASGALAFIQPAYAWQVEGAPRLVQTSLLIRDTVRAAPTLQALAGGRAGATPRGPPDFRSTLRRLYDAMRRAARDGDWAAFGRAFDSIGTLVGRGRP
ncbi:MAG: UPF0182 family protein [Gemmatimonadota bacterium]|nr:UPF0182 family protein [Gemmatimonadota bacterium]